MDLLKYIKFFFSFIYNIITTIKNFIVGIFNLFKGIILFVKNSVDFIYKILFISFFCILAYICYKVFTSATTINKKLNDLQTSIINIQQTAEDLSRTTKMIADGIDNTVKRAKKITGKTGKELTEKIKQYGK